MSGSDHWISGNRDRWYGERPHQHDEPFDDHYDSHGVLRSTRRYAKTVILDQNNPPVRRSSRWSGD